MHFALYAQSVKQEFDIKKYFCPLQSDELLSFLEDYKPCNPDEFISIKEEPEDVLVVCAGEPEVSELKQEQPGPKLPDGMGKDTKCLESAGGEFMTTIALDKAIENYAAEPSMNENMWWEESFPELFPTLA